MKTLGLIGGMSWESTAIYYQEINRSIQQKLGGLHSAKIILSSVDFADIETLQRQQLWQKAGDLLQKEALKLQSAGAEGIVLCTNTMHLIASQIEHALTIPFLHIIDATADAIVAQNITVVGLLGTAFTMEPSFYTDRLKQKGLTVHVPNEVSRDQIHQIIYRELCQGIVLETSKQIYIDVICDLKKQGVQAIILGCTEIRMLLPEASVLNLPIFDTTQIHINQAVSFALSK